MSPAEFNTIFFKQPNNCYFERGSAGLLWSTAKTFENFFLLGNKY